MYQIRDRKRSDLNLPPMEQNDPDKFRKTASNLNGNRLSNFLPKSTTFVDPRATPNNNVSLSDRFDQNDFFVRVSV